jgi:peptidoglycan biosynthesis protein MviN/MurJ (putative lipid II flippase)
VLLRRRLDGLEETAIANSFARITIAAAVMGTAVWLTDGWLTALWTGAGLLKQVLIVGSDISVGLAVLSAAAHMLGIAEFKQARHELLVRLTRTHSR